MLPTMHQGSTAMMDGFRHENCPRIVGGCKKMQNVVLLILKVSEHDNQPELEHELLPQYVIDTGEYNGNVCFFRNDILQYETAIRNMSLAEDWRIDTREYINLLPEFFCANKIMEN